MYMRTHTHIVKQKLSGVYLYITVQKLFSIGMHIQVHLQVHKPVHMTTQGRPKL